jgi:hypothetical protein
MCLALAANAETRNELLEGFRLPHSKRSQAYRSALWNPFGRHLGASPNTPADDPFRGRPAVS